MFIRTQLTQYSQWYEIETEAMWNDSITSQLILKLTDTHLCTDTTKYFEHKAIDWAGM